MKWNRLLFLFCFFAKPSYADYRLQVTVRDTDLRYETDAQVQMLIEDPDVKPGACLYIPLEDPAFRRSTELHSLTGNSVRDQASRIGTALQWVRPDQFQAVRPGYWRINTVEHTGSIQFSYALRIGGWKDAPDRPRIVSDFYPRLLPNCPDLDPEEFPDLTAENHYSVTLQIPNGWQQLNPGKSGDGGSIQYRGRDFYFVLYQKGDVHETELDGLRLRFLAHSKEFLKIQRVVKTVLRHHYGLLGRWPTDDLLLIDSAEYEPVNVAGLIVINRPSQALMRHLQEEILNWKIWQLTMALAEQWFGYQVRVSRLQDVWLTQSLADSLGLLFLKDSEQYGNLFTAEDDEEPWFQLNFSQVQDLLAATLSLMQSHNAVLGPDQKSMPDMLQRPPYAFIRSSQALRVLLKEMGRKEFGRFLRDILDQGAQKTLTPERILALLRARFPESYAPLLRDYWQSDVWPDARLVDVDASEDGKGTAVRINYTNDLPVPVDVVVGTRDGQEVVQHVQPKQAEEPIIFPTAYKNVKWVDIDPHRSIFDSDRYNNSSRWVDLNFFPGTARTLADDAYTIVWVPFLQKLPGNELSITLGWQLFRYVGTGLTGLVVYQPGTGRTGFRLEWESNMPERSLKLRLRVSQDDDRTLPGERETSFTLARRPIWKAVPGLDLYTRQRLKQTLDIPRESHLASGLGLILRSENRQTCNWKLVGEHALSSWVPKGDFSYQRSMGFLRTQCEVPGWQWQTQLFTGVSKRKGIVPKGGLFQPQDVEESRLRLDHPRLAAVGRLQTWSTDVSTPLRLPLPSDLLVLPRRSLFKIFADGGRLMEPDSRVISSGAGLVLPIGGDVVGKQPVTFLEFSMLAVLYRKIDDRTDTKPGLLFDFGGQL